MTTRVLPESEWHRLVDVPLPDVGTAATKGVVIAVESESGEIVGSCAVFQCVHIDGLWIHPSHRGKTAVARRLIAATRQAVKGMGVSAAVTTVLSGSPMASLWRKRGASEVLGQHLMVAML
jgi:hypothetical protein